MVGSSIYIPAIPSVRTRFNVSETVALLPYSLHAFGNALGPVVAPPVSETFGRRVTYVPYLTMYIIFTLGAGFSDSAASLIVCRFFAGVAGSPVLSIGVGTVADMYSP